ncbi:Histidine protein methyltransferase 1-like [Vitis vinifera]|uniref:protein-histidine N-methyltransferase n=1 Tax=Vitis vinifera TaxID=29760 RepID=A0A438HFE0_VITVI|nr:Histidine protein methyltransferase 1-like [Vitis vinifera]
MAGKSGATFDDNPQFRLGILDSSETHLPPPPPPPPCVEVLFTESVSSSVRYTVERVNLNGLTLLKVVFSFLLFRRVNTQDVFAFSNSDLVPGQYEGGLKLWEGSLDLVKALRSEVQNGRLSFTGKRVLESLTHTSQVKLILRSLWKLKVESVDVAIEDYVGLPGRGFNLLKFEDDRAPSFCLELTLPFQIGCGHGFPGILACLEGAAVVHFQDFNAEVLRCLTIPNVNANLSEKSSSLATNATEVRCFAGDWSEIHQLLPHACDNEKDQTCMTGQSTAGYDIILMAETVYSISALPTLYELIKKVSCIELLILKILLIDIVFLSSKNLVPTDHEPSSWRGVYGSKEALLWCGRGSRRFLSVVEKDGIMVASLVAEVTDGSSNVREVWKFSFK